MKKFKPYYRWKHTKSANLQETTK